MFKAKQRITSVFVAFCTFLVTAILAISMIAVPTNSVTASADTMEIVFTLGANGSASHSDGNTTSVSSYSETVDGYTLNITNGTNMYKGARDAKGNGCIKLGSSKNAGSFKFTVPNDVTSVIICVAKYKTNTTKVSINGGTAKTLTKNSNDGAYDEITVDTTSNKTVSFATASGGVRAMMNTITFVIADDSACEHENAEETNRTEAGCETDGSIVKRCPDCGEEITTPIPATGHTNNEEITTPATCTEVGSKTVTCDNCDFEKTQTIPMLPHTYENGKCVDCGKKQPSEATISFADKSKRIEYSTSKQVWQQNGITVTNNKASSTTNVGDYANPARFYKSSTVTISCANMEEIVIDSATGEYLTALQSSLQGVAYTVNGSKVTITLPAVQDEFTFTCTGGQVRVNSITVYVAAPAEPEVPAETTIYSASLTIGSEISLNYYVVMADEAHKDATMHFTVKFSGNSNGNDQTYDVEGVAQEDGRYVYSLALAPQLMTTKIDAELKLGDEVLASKKDYSIVEYAKNRLAETSNEKEKQAISDLLRYGAAAQQYTGYDMNHLATADVVGILPADSKVVPTEEDKYSLENATLEEGASYPVWFAGAGVQFSNVNKIFVKLNLLEGATLENVTLTINGTEVEVTDATVYTDGILPTKFADTYTFVLSYDGVVMQTLTYSVNAYAYAMSGKGNTMSMLALALYNYGVSAAEYIA